MQAVRGSFDTTPIKPAEQWVLMNAVGPTSEMISRLKVDSVQPNNECLTPDHAPKSPASDNLRTVHGCQLGYTLSRTLGERHRQPNQ